MTTLTVDHLNEWATSDLVAFHNEHTGNPELNQWKKKKALLIEIIADKVDLEAFGDDGEPLETREVSDDPVDKGPTIKSISIDLLCRVDYYEDKTEKPGDDNRVSADHPNARAVGLTYNAILDEIRRIKPDCNTSAECLRWYVVRINQEDHGYEGHKLPGRRPRSKKVVAQEAPQATEE